MWKCLHCDLRALSTHVTGLLHSSSPRSSSKQNHLLSTRWGYKSHCKKCNEHFAPTFSWTSHFQIWRHWMASKITWLIGVWFLEWCVVFFYVLCYVSRPLIHLFLQMLKYVLPYKRNCLMISNTLIFLTLKNRLIRWRTLYMSTNQKITQHSRLRTSWHHLAWVSAILSGAYLEPLISSSMSVLQAFFFTLASSLAFNATTDLWWMSILKT